MTDGSGGTGQQERPLERKDSERVEALAHALTRLDEDLHPDGDASWIAELKDLLHLDVFAMYGLRFEEQQIALGYARTLGGPVSPREFVLQFDESLRGAPGRWGVFNPAFPEPEQRNRSLAFPDTQALMELMHRREFLHKMGVRAPEEAERVRTGFAHIAEFFRSVGVARHWQLRALVCEDNWLLGWVGGFSLSKPSERELQILQALVPPIHKRLSADQLLSRNPLASVTLSAAMEAISRAAYIVNAQGMLLHANSLGRVRYDQHPTDTRATMLVAIESRGVRGGFSVTALASGEQQPRFLLVTNTMETPQERASRAARRWSLTPRQTAVLVLAVEGLTNKAIAAKLGCAERTIEVHMQALMHKADADSRSALAAKFWTTL